MGKDTFLLLFVTGSAAVAAWIALRLPRLGPKSFRAASVHLAATVVVGGLLGPLVHAVPGLPSRLSVLVALFAIAFPAITYMQLVGMWLIRLAAARAALRH